VLGSHNDDGIESALQFKPRSIHLKCNRGKKWIVYSRILHYIISLRFSFGGPET
jgi:hypothetical protein